jgi:thymidylate synthase
MNNLDIQYQSLLIDILGNGVIKSDRTGTGTTSVFGRQIRHKMSEGFPLLTTKKMAWKTMVVELLWFLRGETNIKFLLDYDCHIWDGDAYKRYERARTWELQDVPPMNEFIKKIKTDDEFAKTWGELGPIYGKQWRKWERYGYRGVQSGALDMGMISKEEYENEVYVDQIQNLINDLKTNPDSRRLMVNAWNVSELDKMVLPPCHYGFQVYTRELRTEEWINLMIKKHGMVLEGGDDTLPTRAISLMWNQRSVDVPLGLPFNIASYGLLLEIIAKEVNMAPDELIGNLGDCHIYLNQIDGVKEQISRTSFDLPSIKITERNWYQHEKVKEHLGEKTFSEKILSYRPDCFELIGYQSHSKIKIPLSN